MQRTAADVNTGKIVMLTGDGKTGGFRLKQHRIGNAAADFIQIHGFAPQNDSAVFQLSHIQNIVHQRQKQLRGQLDFMQTIAYARVVVLIFRMIVSMPMMPLMGVRISCDMLFRNVVLAALAALACVAPPAALSGSAAA